MVQNADGSFWPFEALTDSESHVGQVGGNCITKSFSFTRPSDTTQYSAKDALNVKLVVSGATNANPIVITTGVHGLSDGDYVTISGIVGNTNGNGSFYVKTTGQSSPTTMFALFSDKALAVPVAGNGAWSSGGYVSRMFRLKGIFRKAGGDGYVTKIQIFTDLSTWIDQLRLHFYGAPTVSLLDNAVFVVLFVNSDKRSGIVDMPQFTTEGSGSDMAYTLATQGNNPAINIPLHVRNVETIPDTDLWVRAEDLGTGIPASAQNFTIQVTVDNN